MRSNVDLSIVVISLNSMAYLRECLTSIVESELRDVTYEIIAVDNGSTDGSVEFLRREWPDVIVIANPANVGFCKAGNQGAEVSTGRYVLVLNDDTIIRDDALALLVEFMDAHPDAGVIGSRLLNTDGTDQFSSGRTFPTPMNALFGRKSVLTRLLPNARWARQYLLSDRIDGTEPYVVDWVSAAAMLVRRETWGEAGGLAEDFYYFHESVFCARAQQVGYKVYLHPRSFITHHEGAGSGTRTRRIRRLHITRFHMAAFRWYCLHHRVGSWSPLRPLIAGVLFVRAAALVAVELVKPQAPQVVAEIRSGRPEGGATM